MTTKKITATQTYIREFGNGEAYGLHKPIPVLVTEENEVVCALFDDANIFGEGKTAVDAIANLKDAILDEYDDMRDIKDVMGSLLAKDWKMLQSYIYEKTGGEK